MFLALAHKSPDQLYDCLCNSNNFTINKNNLTYAAWDINKINQGNYFYAFSHIPFCELNIQKDTFTITCFRDPSKRIISHYKMLLYHTINNVKHPCMKIERKWLGNNFEDFLMKIPKEHLLNQIVMFSPTFDINEAIDNIMKVSHVMFTERLKNDIKTIQKKLNICLPYTHTRKSDLEVEISSNALSLLNEKLSLEYILLSEIKSIILDNL